MASRLKSKVNAQMAYINAYVIFGEPSPGDSIK